MMTRAIAGIYVGILVFVVGAGVLTLTGSFVASAIAIGGVIVSNLLGFMEGLDRD
jgi:glycerol uptake facilitator-like aquaporin